MMMDLVDVKMLVCNDLLISLIPKFLIYQADLNLGLTGGLATWTGKGTWTGAATETICVNFYDLYNNKPTCCCKLAKRTLEEEQSSELTGCACA